jgi:hypothetical protein
MVLDSTTISIDTCVEVITRAARDVFEKSAAEQKSGVKS